MPKVLRAINTFSSVASDKILYGVNVVRVDRHTNWGNPFIMNGYSDKERDRVCDLFVEYVSWRLSIEPDWLVLLKGKDLVCHCKPKRCHADTLLILANR